MKIAYFDCFAGTSGDMTLGALIGAGADPERLREALAGLGVGGYRIEVGKKMAGPIEATNVHVHLDDHHQHHHRRLNDILEIIGGANLSEGVKQTAGRIFQRLAEAEAKVHGSSPEEVHFHEVGAVDAIVDIVGTAICLELLGWPKVIASPIPTFHGYAKGSHGVFPLPAPATAEILRGIPWRKVDIEGELVTPTGAAIIREIAVEFGPLPAMIVESIGYGAGKSDYGIPNALRVMLGQEAAGAESQEVTVIETNIDDLNPQTYETAMEQLFAAGALDVFLTPIQMKKNRPGTLLSVICDPGLADTLAAVILAETSTFGVRISRWERMCLDRRWQEVVTEFGVIRIKIGERGGRVLTASPEYEECKRAAAKHGAPIRRVHEAALMAYGTASRDPGKGLSPS
jgi:pyridinium-3,5-bisthiocarboxylic acid mononucleotide nickel chelatase